jgi:hypothetical protein
MTAWGYAFRSRKGDVAGAMVLAWALFGVYDHQSHGLIRYFALGCFIVSALAIVKVCSPSPLCRNDKNLTRPSLISQSLYFTFVTGDGHIALGDDERAPLVA